MTFEASTLAAGGDPTGYVFNGVQHVAYRGVDGHIHVLFTGPDWRFRNVTFEAGAPKAAGDLDGDPSGYVVNGVQHVAYRGVDGHIHVLFAGPDWRFRNVTVEAQANRVQADVPGPASNPSAYTS